MPEANKISEALLKLILAAFDHAVDSMRAKGKGPCIPIVMFEREEGSHEVRQFKTGTPLEGMEAARKHVPELPREAKRYAVVFYGFVTLDGMRSDAVIAEAGERGQPNGFAYFQRCRPKKFLSGFGIVGPPGALGTVSNYFGS